MLKQREYWEATLEREGMMAFSLPGNDGRLLRDQAIHGEHSSSRSRLA